MLTLILAIKALTEIAALAVLGQSVLGWLSGQGRENNPFYRVLQVVGRPVLSAARRLSPRWVLDRHLPVLALVLLAWVWLAATLAKISWCLDHGVNQCR